MSDPQDALIPLEEKLTHLEATVDQLNSVVTELFDRVIRSETRTEQLHAKLAALTEDGKPTHDDADGNDPDAQLRDLKPPHW
ncbi:MAG: SlyX family protein [Planctomycetota bacterium]